MEDNKELKQNFPDAEQKNAKWGGDGCILFWGTFEKVCEVIGKVIVSICTLGIVPLIVYTCRKKNQKAE